MQGDDLISRLLLLPRLAFPFLLSLVFVLLWRGTTRLADRPILRLFIALGGMGLVGVVIFLAAWSWASGS